MTAKPVLCSVTASVFLLAAISPASTGGRPAECYERYRTAPVYDTFNENVMVSPGSRHVEYVPPVYGLRRRAVMITPWRTSYEVIPAVVEVQHRTVKVAGGYTWEWRWINGRKVLCKVRRGPRFQTISKTVVVQPEYRRRVVLPPEYAYEIQQVILKPASGRVIGTPATYRTVSRQVLVSGGEAGWRRLGRRCG